MHAAAAVPAVDVPVPEAARAIVRPDPAAAAAGPDPAAAAAQVRSALLAPPAWLVAVADGAAVTDVLAAVLPGATPARAGPDRVVTCELLDLRARGAVWKVRYRVALASSSGERTDVVLAGRAAPPDGALAATPPSAGGEPGTAGWHVAIPALGLDLRTETADRRLPAAAALLDPARAGALLADGLAAAYGGARPRAWTATAARYVYGARCTVVYRLAYPDDPRAGAAPDRADRTDRADCADRPDRPVAVVAKAHAGGAGAAVDAGMRALWATRLARGDVVRIARPLGYLPDAGVVLQEALPGDRTLREVLADVGLGGDPAPATALLRRVADGLVALHRCGAAPAVEVTWDDDLARARRTVSRLAPTWPAAARTLDPVLDLLADRVASTSGGTPGPSHGAFRPSQVLVDGDRIAFLDLDGFCRAEPERDVGRFTKAVAKALLPAPGTSAEVRTRAAALSRELTGVVVDRYAAAAPLDRRRVALWEALDVVSGLAQTAATLRPGAEPLLRMLDRVVTDPVPTVGAPPAVVPA